MLRPRNGGELVKIRAFPTRLKAMHETEQKVAIVTGAPRASAWPAPAPARRRRARDAGRHQAGRRGRGQKLGAQARFFAADVSLKAEVDAHGGGHLAAFGRIDILVNNAGVTHAADFLDLSEDDFDRVLRINLKSMFLCGQAVARQMVKRGAAAASSICRA
jgi:glucose 1-dehydrogenase